jgi:hypothetical protein
MLNVAAVTRAKPRATAYQMTDGRGLYLLLTPAGGRLWLFPGDRDHRKPMSNMAIAMP